MATVTVKFFATVREAVGRRSAEIEAANIRELLELLKQKYGKRFTDTVIDDKTGELKRFYQCMVNGKRIELLDGYETELNDYDSVALFPPVGGG
ncbi:MAG: ubiquitin-like small modifier protein 1 [Promethearchaeota archaeon]